MASGLYDKAREAFLSGTISWTTDNIKVVAVDAGTYSVSLSTNQYLSDIAVGARIATSGNLASKTVTNGVADAADITLTAVSGASVEALVIYKDTGSAATSPLIAYLDSAVSGLPFTPNGGDIVITFDNGSNKIFKL